MLQLCRLNTLGKEIKHVPPVVKIRFRKHLKCNVFTLNSLTNRLNFGASCKKDNSMQITNEIQLIFYLLSVYYMVDLARVVLIMSQYLFFLISWSDSQFIVEH